MTPSWAGSAGLTKCSALASCLCLCATSISCHCDLRMELRCSLLTLLACWALKTSWALNLRPSEDMEFTFLLPAGSRECFYQSTAKDDSLEFEYQVIGERNQDVGFVMVSPSGIRHAYDYRRTHAVHNVDRTEEGDYKLCFDNSFSTLKDKMLFFALVITSPSNTDSEDLIGDDTTKNTLEDQLEDIRIKLKSMYSSIQRSHLIQLMLRNFSTRDQHLQDDNLWRVTFWSSVGVLSILTVAGVQVYVLQSLFDKNTTC
ncbi:transmembrane emp24 domain-containing protein 1-like [Dunckerocampus dactyliophorus]|uniref:transmembrane emp24 domain-containing protein 1-like n=1 Tax=Dunckerocampus dactyliophorus TaxID=161453 RepID=UPI0024068012|nr:transmembrane emp24 domain-containing protein 1-like [Dunckerocampus dactyliophorus]XP_054616791.1 transmembrane emp24 domain-containing protein 1-like [Dunckerocampus dactyliophorus]XP_054616792.1 transmembrane emp24 domain-containing protein 1-like [Dunckerocampus dactyliophorus]XP_054616793.1 transmembrane emp24 domain-containing protein 1-like [Dunckerocampus dactyliophorus]